MAALRRTTGRTTGSTKGRSAISGPLTLVAVLVLTCGAGYAWHETRHSDSSRAGLDAGSPAGDKPGGRGAGSADGDAPSGRSSGRSSAGEIGAPTASPRGTGKDGQHVEVPSSGTGTFSTARANAPSAGHGTVRRYKVQVEGGIDLPAGDAAHEIAAILADPRGWTADGHDAFQLVSSGPADFVIKIATPDTVDSICGAAGLLTGGEVNCDVGATVVVNLKRWMLGSPEFAGPIQDYRALIINHEVGHRIGHHHEGCPGPGRLAPVMMQQIKGLHGCIANAWPYDRKGHYIQGPPAP